MKYKLTFIPKLLSFLPQKGQLTFWAVVVCVGLVVDALTFYSDYLSSNPAEVYS